MMKSIAFVSGLIPMALCLLVAVMPQPVAHACDTTPPTGTIVINNNRSATNTPNVTLALTWNDGSDGSGVTRMRFSDNGATWTVWMPPTATRVHTLPGADGHKTVRVQYLDRANNRSQVYNDYIRLDTAAPTGGIVINNGASVTPDRVVTLNLAWSDGAGAGVSRMRLSDDGAHWTVWSPPSATRAHALRLLDGYHTVRAQYMDGAGNYSAACNDYIKLKLPPCPMEMVPVAAGTFTMGNSGVGDDAVVGQPDEFPAHSVTLSSFQIGKHDVTNRQYCEVLNWALARGCLTDSTGAAWTGAGDIFAGGELQFIVGISSEDCNIQYADGLFSPKIRDGLPGVTCYPTDEHPVVRVSWYGAAAFCNWLSLMQGLTPCYDMNAAGWPLAAAPPTPDGYRLPTEAEWECAAAWDGTRHWTYGFTSDTLEGKARANYFDGVPDFMNPLGLATMPYTSPVGWYNGINVSPNGNVQTVDSHSPAGCYDMSGEVWQWCGDWYSEAYYGASAAANPAGPASGSARVLRGGSWGHGGAGGNGYRTAGRGYNDPMGAGDGIGFRVAR